MTTPLSSVGPVSAHPLPPLPPPIVAVAGEEPGGPAEPLHPSREEASGAPRHDVTLDLQRAILAMKPVVQLIGWDMERYGNLPLRLVLTVQLMNLVQQERGLFLEQPSLQENVFHVVSYLSLPQEDVLTQQSALEAAKVLKSLSKTHPWLTYLTSLVRHKDCLECPLNTFAPSAPAREDVSCHRNREVVLEMSRAHTTLLELSASCFAPLFQEIANWEKRYEEQLEETSGAFKDLKRGLPRMRGLSARQIFQRCQITNPLLEWTQCLQNRISRYREHLPSLAFSSTPHTYSFQDILAHTSTFQTFLSYFLEVFQHVVPQGDPTTIRHALASTRMFSKSKEANAEGVEQFMKDMHLQKPPTGFRDLTLSLGQPLSEEFHQVEEHLSHQGRLFTQFGEENLFGQTNKANELSQRIEDFCSRFSPIVDRMEKDLQLASEEEETEAQAAVAASLEALCQEEEAETEPALPKHPHGKAKTKVSARASKP